MLELIRSGLRTGIVTTRYPKVAEEMPRGYVGQIELRPGRIALADAAMVVDACPTRAIAADGEGRVRLDRGRCICCGRCVRIAPEQFAASGLIETAVTNREDLIVASDAPTTALERGVTEQGHHFRRSLHIRHIDTGDDNATVSEVKLLGSPAYDLHRLGFFFTTSPRHADALLVTGVVTKPMERPLRETYEAMPSPRLVIAAGAEAISGVPFDNQNAVAGGVDAILPVDVYIPGSPPSPLALLDGLLLAVGRARQDSGRER